MFSISLLGLLYENVLFYLQVTDSQSNEPGWLSGEVRGHVGWFPEAYVEKMDVWSETHALAVAPDLAKRQHLEGIQELPENVSDNGSIADANAPAATLADSSQSAFMPVGAKVPDDTSSPILGQVCLILVKICHKTARFKEEDSCRFSLG